MTLKEQVAYLKGLSEGLDMNTESKEGKLIIAIIETLTLMADEIDDLTENALDIGEELDALSEDLADVEQYVFKDGEIDDEVFYDYDEEDDETDVEADFEKVCDSDCFCDLCSGTDVTFDVTCPACGTDIELDESDLSENGINCPKCNELLEFEFEDDNEDVD